MSKIDTPLKIDISLKKGLYIYIFFFVFIILFVERKFHLPTNNFQGTCWFSGDMLSFEPRAPIPNAGNSRPA